MLEEKHSFRHFQQLRSTSNISSVFLYILNCVLSPKTSKIKILFCKTLRQQCSAGYAKWRSNIKRTSEPIGTINTDQNTVRRPQATGTECRIFPRMTQDMILCAEQAKPANVLCYATMSTFKNWTRSSTCSALSPPRSNQRKRVKTA